MHGEEVKTEAVKAPLAITKPDMTWKPPPEIEKADKPIKQIGSACAVLLLFLSMSTACVSKAYVAADRATFEAVAPEYRAYVEQDSVLDGAQKERRFRTLETWLVRLEAAEGKK